MDPFVFKFLLIFCLDLNDQSALDDQIRTKPVGEFYLAVDQGNMPLTLDTTSGFASQVTGVRERDTGFVRPISSAEPRSKRPSQVPAEIQMTLRTPSDTSDPYSAMELPTDDAPPASASISLSYDDPPTTERPISAAAADLINSLPSPTPNALASSSGSSPARTDTAEMPNPLRPPARAPDDPILSSTTTQDFESQKTNAQLAKPASSR